MMHSHYQIDPLLFQVSQQWNGAQKVDSVSNLVLITLKEFGVPFPPSLVLFLGRSIENEYSSP